MARLPQPGGDSGTWGDILNDFLAQAHNPDGSIKSLSQSQVQNLVADLANKVNANDLAPVAKSGSYTDLVNKPTPADIGAVSASGLDSATAAVVGNAGSSTKAALNSSYVASTLLATGESTMERMFATGAPQIFAGRIDFTYFTARKSETINNVRMFSVATAAAPTPTTVKIGIYSVAANGDLTLLGATANDTTIFSATFSTYLRALTTPVTKVAGQTYALAVVVATTATAPQICGIGGPSATYWNTILGASPRLAGETPVNTYTDLPASLPAASVSNGRRMYYAELLP